jgi:hypothetical protein
VAWLAVPYFSTLSINDFRKKLFNVKCAFWFSLQLLSETFLSSRVIQRDIRHVKSFRLKYPLFLSYFNETWIPTFFFFFSKIVRCQMSWKSIYWEPSCSVQTDKWMDWRTYRQTDRQTYMTKLIIAFRNFANAP